MAAASATERIARQEQRSDDIDRRLIGLENGQREILMALAAMRDDLHRSRGRAAVVGGIMDWVKLTVAASVGAGITAAATHAF
jgi:hypothetical protein